MGIDAKEIGATLWKILGFSMSTSIKFMRNHPILSGVFMFLLALYIFLPSLLFFLIYSSPVLACAIVYAQEKLGLRFSDSHNSGSNCCGGESNGVKCHLRQQRSVRRNARMKVEEWDSQTSEDEKDKVILTSLDNDLLGRTPHFEESPKAIEETDVEEEEDNEKKKTPKGISSLGLTSLIGEEEPMVCNCEINEEKNRDFDGKEETTSFVEYGGVSEIDRNKRLESLIARRRARRLFKLALNQRDKLQAEETISPTLNNNNNKNNKNNLHITVPRNMFDQHQDYRSDGTVMGLKMPGSAPSVMLQGRNPFDIPYDPQEERPNLTGDSFDQEFSLFAKKDMFFCRHESFCRFSLFSPRHAQCMNSTTSASEVSASRKCLESDDRSVKSVKNGEKEEMESKKEEGDDDDSSCSEGSESELNRLKNAELKEDTDSNKEGDDDSSSSEESETELSRMNKAELKEAICHSMDNYPGFLVNQTRNGIPIPFPRAVPPRLDDNNMFYARRGASSHNRTFSVASDMQVEVSEIGSPPTTVDWLDDWSNGGESYTYDTDIDREIVRGEESQKKLTDQYESRSGIGTKEEDNGTGTKPDQKCAVDDDDTSMLGRKSQTEEDVKQVAEGIFEQKPCSFSDMFKRSNSGKFEGLLFHTSVSLSSITEEPETILDSNNRGNSESMNYLIEESSGDRSLASLDSSKEKLIDVRQLENDDLSGSPMMIDHQQLNNGQGEHDAEINMKKYEDTKPGEYEALTSDLKTSSSNVLTELPESDEVMEENGPTLVENTDEKAEPTEQEKAYSSHPHTQLVEDSSTTLDKSTDQEISKEGENSGLMKDLSAELTEKHSNRTEAEEESVVSADIQNSEEPLSLEINQQQEHEYVIVPNNVFEEISKDESVAVAEDSAGNKNNDEETLKLNDQISEAMEKKVEPDLEPMHHSIGLVDREDDEESKKVIKAIPIAETQTTKDGTRVSED